MPTPTNTPAPHHLISDVVVRRARPSASALRNRRRRPAALHEDYQPYMLPRKHAQAAVRMRRAASPTLDELMKAYAASGDGSTLKPASRLVASGAATVPASRTKHRLQSAGALAASISQLLATGMQRLPKRYQLRKGLVVNWQAVPRKRAAAVLIAALTALSVLSLGPAGERPQPTTPTMPQRPGLPAILSGRDTTVNDGSNWTTAGTSTTPWSQPAGTTTWRSTPATGSNNNATPASGPWKNVTAPAGTSGGTTQAPVTPPGSGNTTPQPATPLTPSAPQVSTPPIAPVQLPVPAPAPAPLVTVPPVTVPLTGGTNGVTVPGIALGL